MRITLAAVLLLTAACSTNECSNCARREPLTTRVFYDTDDDGLPDTRREVAVFVIDEDEVAERQHEDVVVFYDTDDDGLPDTRSEKDFRGLERSGKAREARIERALARLERAIADVRRALH